MRELGLHNDGAVLIHGAFIEEAGPGRRIENLAEARAAREIDVAGKVVMPGFVDCHTHLSLACLPRDGTARPEHAIRTTSPMRLALRAQRILRGMARHGTTSVGVASEPRAEESLELKMLRVLSMLSHDPLDVVVSHAAIERLSPAFLAKIHRRKVSLVRLREDFNLALESEAFALDHLASIPPDDVERLARSPAIAILSPHSPSVRSLIDSGAAVALSTDFHPADNPCYSMQAALSLACSRMEMDPAEAITAATVNAAHVLRLADRAGCFRPGRYADLIVLDVPDYRDLASGLGVNHVCLTMKQGVLLSDELT